LKKDGWGVIATDKRENSDILRLDVSDSDSIEKTVERVEDMTKGKLYGLINNAGIAYAGRMEDITRDDLRRQFEVNVFGVHGLIIKLLPIFRKNNEGRIINIGSISGLVAFPNMGAYSASKFALEALTDAFRLELIGTGIKISLIEPGTIESDFRKNAVCRNFKLKEKKGKSPEIVYRKVRHALLSKRPKTRYLAGEEHMVYLRRLLSDALLDKLLMKYSITR